jgi:hypothetical protein
MANGCVLVCDSKTHSKTDKGRLNAILTAKKWMRKNKQLIPVGGQLNPLERVIFT